MSDIVENPMAPIGPGPEYRGASIWLPQLYLEAARQGVYTIENKTFVECLLEGPAVVLPIGGCVFDDCFLGQHGGDPKALMLVPMSPSQVLGAVSFLNCRFERCRFVGVGFTGDPQFLESFLAAVPVLPA